MAFERFTNTNKSFISKVSIRSNGQIGFSQGLIHKFHLESFKFGVLFYDKDEGKVGIQLTNDEKESGICKLQVRPQNASLSAKAFLDFFDLDYQETRSYPMQWDEENKMIIVNLKDYKKATV
ncbi:MAG: hypothetical protein A2048_08745 [Deltaproteobacteria bacterium GWA2_45_12]|nr:MAG: hypothetical protein A2048_08745 [Deltaproteobacteria bacterium GWA2_45_12]